VIGFCGQPEATLEPYRYESLIEVKEMTGMGAEPVDDGWNAESARLFAIDVAMLMYKRDPAAMVELDRIALLGRLGEARRLVVEGKDGDLGYVQNEFEVYLVRASNQARSIWLTAINAMIPSPFRAARACVEAAIALSDVGDLPERIVDRLRARMEEGSLIAQPPAQLLAHA
jgi:hypothetical protein